MATNEIHTTVSVPNEQEKKSDLLESIKGFFQKWNNEWNNTNRKTKAFVLTRKDSIVAMIAALVIMVWFLVYWYIVLNNYSDINSKSDTLKNLSTYNVSPDLSILNPYVEWNDANTIDWMININNNIQETLSNREEFKKQQKNYYEILLQNIYLPSLNVWKDPYTKDFDISVLWQKYLEKDKFQDLYLIQYWSDFIKYVWNDADYNTIDNISIWDTVEVESSDYFYTPISVSFSSPNKRSFLLLVNKLSMTSNTNNVALLNEFFFYLLRHIKEDKAEIVNDLAQKYWDIFSSSSNRDWPSELSKLSESQLSDYQDKVIGYNLYHWINYEWTWENPSLLIDDNLIMKTIRENALCDSLVSDSECLYNFRDKYRNLPYLAYRIWLDNQWAGNRTQWLLNFLQDLPSVIAITQFGFNKYSNASFLNREEERYEWSVSFNAYWRTITSEELEEASSKLWKLCFWEKSDNVISPESAILRINDTISSLWWSDTISSLWWSGTNVNVSALWELQWILTSIQSDYEKQTNYNKMIKLFEIWRMLNDANLCNKA